MNHYIIAYYNPVEQETAIRTTQANSIEAALEGLEGVAISFVAELPEPFPANLVLYEGHDNGERAVYPSKKAAEETFLPFDILKEAQDLFKEIGGPTPSEYGINEAYRFIAAKTKARETQGGGK